jgi:methionine aminopeptidase
VRCINLLERPTQGTVTVDGSLAAHYENTILITDGACELLTVDENGEPA